jgi:hypothetical protein
MRVQVHVPRERAFVHTYAPRCVCFTPNSCHAALPAQVIVIPMPAPAQQLLAAPAPVPIRQQPQAQPGITAIATNTVTFGPPRAQTMVPRPQILAAAAPAPQPIYVVPPQQLPGCRIEPWLCGK